MKKVILILGNITFEEGKAIVHEIYGIIDCSNNDSIGKTPEQVAEEIGEDLCNLFLAYLIPSEYKGKIVYECERGISLLTDEEKRMQKAMEYLCADNDEELEEMVKAIEKEKEEGFGNELISYIDGVEIWEKVDTLSVDEFLRLID